MTVALGELGGVLIFMVVVARVTGFMLGIPALSDATIPLRLRTAFALVLSWVLAASLPASYVEVCSQIANLPSLLLLLGTELMFGLTVALGTRLIMETVKFAGGLIDRDLGLAMSEFFNPAIEDTTTICAALLLQVFLVLFMTLNAHHELIRLLGVSFSRVGPGVLLLDKAIEGGVYGLASRLFIDAFCLTLPIFAMVALTNLVLALMARFAQEFEVMMLSFPVRLGGGLLILAAMTPMFVHAFRGLNESMSSWVNWLMMP